MNINPIDFNYIDGTNTYPIVEYIDDNINITSNILNTKINYSSNILNTKIDYTSNILNNLIIYSSNNNKDYTNILRTDISKLIEQKQESILLPIPATLTHTYIYNSNLAGEIRFFVASASSFPVVVPIGIPAHRTKIDLDGKLKIYYTYDPAINLTYGNGWVDIVNSIVGLNAADTNLGITFAGLEVNTTYNIKRIDVDISAIKIALTGAGLIDPTLTNQYVAQFSTLTSQPMATALYSQLTNLVRTGNFTYLNNIANLLTLRITQNPAVAFFLGVGGIAFTAIISGITNLAYAENILSQIKNNITSNVNLSSNLKTELLSSNQDEINKTLIDYASNLYDISYYQGFLNSNTLSAQLIPNLSTSNINLIKGNISNVNNINCTSITTNQINLNSKVITTLALKDIDNFIQTQYGTYFDITNGTLAINSTPTTTDFFRVGGQTTIQGDIIGETKIKITNINQAFPSVGINGGNGDRLILKEGTASTYPVSFGFSGLDLWYSVPTAVSHRFYVNGSLISSIFSAGLSTTGYINASTNLRENGVNLSSKYLQLSGGSMTGNLSTTGTINASTNLQENGVNLTSKYLQLSGGSMTGQITGVTTLNGTTGIFGTLQTTNNTNVAVPSVGVAGGIGDKLILYSGSASTYPYSFGINTNELWYSTPSGASHKFYNNGNNILTLNSSGDITISGSVNITSANQFLTFGQRLQDNLIKLWTDGNFTFGLGINTYTLRYNVPTGASHIFYVNVSPITTISSTGLTTTGFINATTNLQENGTNLTSKYLQLSGGTMTGDLSLSTAGGNDPLYISSTNTSANNCIRIKNNLNYNAYIGIAGSTFPGNYANNFFIESAQSSIIFNTSGRTSTSTPNMKINTDGHIETSGYIYAGGTTSGLRINGNDYGNTIYQNATTIGGQPANIGFTLRDANSFNFQSLSTAGAYTTIARFNTTNGLSLFGNMTGGNNVCKRSIFTFTPTGVIIGAFGFRYAQDIQLTNYISTLTGPIGNMYIFRIHIWTTSGDFGDSSANVENMTYLVYLADFGGNPKIRIHTIVNNSNGSIIAVQSSTSIYYNGWNGAGGASQKYCVIENISGY